MFTTPLVFNNGIDFIFVLENILTIDVQFEVSIKGIPVTGLL